MDKYLGRIQKELSERITMYADVLTEGSAKNYDEYQKLVGEIRGLSFAQQLLTDLVRNMEDSDDK